MVLLCPTYFNSRGDREVWEVKMDFIPPSVLKYGLISKNCGAETSVK